MSRDRGVTKSSGLSELNWTGQSPEWLEREECRFECPTEWSANDPNSADGWYLRRSGVDYAGGILAGAQARFSDL